MHAHSNRSDASSSVLFVSELPDEVEMYSTALELSGFRTLHVPPCAGAWHMSADVQPVALIMDAGPPSCGLTEAIAQNMRLNADHHLPVIVLTTHATAADPATPRRIGCERVLMKPCLPDVLVQTLRDVLDATRTTDK